MENNPNHLQEEKEEMECQLRVANSAVENAEEQLRALLSQMGKKSQETQALLDDIKKNPSAFAQGEGPAQRAMAEALLQKVAVEKRFSKKLVEEQQARAKAARAASRLEEETAIFEKMSLIHNNQVQINVAGELFTTSKEAMLAGDESLFEIMYSGRRGSPPPQFFIDRDPNLFVYVLRFLRSMSPGHALCAKEGRISRQSLMIPTDAVQAVLAEAKFFILPSLEAVLLAEDGVSPLRWAVQNNRADAARQLIKAGANNDETGEHTLLCEGARKNSPEMVKLLLDGKANPLQRCSDQKCGGSCANAVSDTGMLQLLVDARCDINQSNGLDSPVYRALSASNEAALQILVEARCDINQSHGGWRPVHRAVKNEKLLQILVDARCNINVTNHAQETPLHIAAKHHSCESSVRLLLASGANKSCKDKNGLTALEVVQYGASDAIKALLR